MIRSVRWPHIVMTTNHDFFLLVPNHQIYHLPMTNSDVYLPGTNVGTISISCLYTDTFNVDNTFFSLTVDFSYHSDNNLIINPNPTDVTPATYQTPPLLSTPETERSLSPACANPQPTTRFFRRRRIHATSQKSRHPRQI